MPLVLVTVPWPVGGSPDSPCLTAQLQGSVSWGSSSWHGLSVAGGLGFISYSHNAVHTNTHPHRHPVVYGVFCTLRFNQALSRASVTARSARRVKDLSPQVMSPTDPVTEGTAVPLTG